MSLKQVINKGFTGCPEMVMDLEETKVIADQVKAFFSGEDARSLGISCDKAIEPLDEV